MAREKKLIKYIFDDGLQEIPSSYKAKCNVTGELVPIYHKFLRKMVEEKYKNNFGLFLKKFVKKGAEEQVRQQDGDDLFKLNAYSDYLIVSYKHCLKVLEDNFNEEAILKTRSEMDHITNCFTKRFNRDITKFV